MKMNLFVHNKKTEKDIISYKLTVLCWLRLYIMHLSKFFASLC